MKKLINKLITNRIELSIVFLIITISLFNIIQLKYDSFKKITLVIDFAIVFVIFLVIFIFDVVVYKKPFVFKNIRFASLRVLFLSLFPSMILSLQKSGNSKYYFFVVFSAIFFGIAFFAWIIHFINISKKKTLDYMVPNSNFKIKESYNKNFWKKELFLVSVVSLISLLELIISFNHNLFNYDLIIITFSSLFVGLLALFTLFIFSKYFKIIKNYWKKKPSTNFYAN